MGGAPRPASFAKFTFGTLASALHTASGGGTRKLSCPCAKSFGAPVCPTRRCAPKTQPASSSTDRVVISGPGVFWALAESRRTPKDLFLFLAAGGRGGFFRLALMREIGAMGTFVRLDILEASLRVAYGVKFLASNAAMRGAAGFSGHNSSFP